jgi:hypothetical protein
MTVPAATWNIVTDQGKTWARSCIYRLGGVPFDNTLWEARLQVKRSFTSSAVIDLDSALGDFTLGGVTGSIAWTVSAVTMEDLSGKYVWDLELYDPGDADAVYGVARGTMTVRPEVTT